MLENYLNIIMTTAFLESVMVVKIKPITLDRDTEINILKAAIRGSQHL